MKLVYLYFPFACSKRNRRPWISIDPLSIYFILALRPGGLVTATQLRLG